GNSTKSPDVESSADTSKLLERVVQAETARRAAEFKIDELEAKLLERTEKNSFEHREAELSGSVRGYRSRIAELEELRDGAEGRLRLLSAELDTAKERERNLEQEAMVLRERLELEFVKAQSAKIAAIRVPSSNEELGHLRAKLEGARVRLDDREEALRCLKLTYEKAKEEAAAAEALRAELDEERSRVKDKEETLRTLKLAGI